MPRKIRVAVIGAGNMGCHHVRNYAALPNAELVAIADINPQVKKLASQHGIEYFDDYKKMFDTLDLDAVSIVVPTRFHYRIAKEAMERGIHCLVEKPIASNIDQASHLIELAQKKKLVFTVGHIERYNPVVRKIKELLKKGAVGEVTSVVAKRVGGFPIIQPLTDVIIDLAVHDIDLLSHLLGRQPQYVTSHGSRTLHPKKVDSAEIFLDYGSASGYVQANWITPVKVRTISITGTDGYLEGNYVTQKLDLYQKNIPPAKSDFKDFVMTAEPAKKDIEVVFKEPLLLELRAFLNAIQGKAKSDLVDPFDAREALKVATCAIATCEMRIS